MATVAATPAFLSGHAFAPNTFAAYNQHNQLPLYRAPTAVHHNPFGAFAPRHHSGVKSASAAASWRHSESVDRTPIATPRTTPKYRRGGPSHSRTSSTSSEASSSSWRERSRSPAAATVELQPATQEQPKPKEPKTLVYTAADLLRLSASPLVGISAESQAVVDDLVAHHVWRRGPRSGTPKTGRGRKNHGTSEQRSSSCSSTSSTADDSERSD